MTMTDTPYDGYGDGWITSPDDPRLVVLWPGSADYDEGLPFPLWVAKTQCADYAPTLPDDDPIPENWVAAQVLQTRALIRSGIVGDSDRIGMGDQTVTVFPMDWTVKNLLRPKRGRFYFGGNRKATT